MSDFIPVEGRSHLYRDADSHAIVNRDKTAYREYMDRKKVSPWKRKIPNLNQ